MIKFNIGQSVEAVEDTPDGLVKGAVYTVLEPAKYSQLVYVMVGDQRRGYNEYRFKNYVPTPIISDKVKNKLKVGDFVKPRTNISENLRKDKVFEIEYITEQGYILLRGAIALLVPTSLVKVHRPSFDQMIKAIKALPNTQSVTHLVESHNWTVDEILRRACS